jgi:Icc protein
MNTTLSRRALLRAGLGSALATGLLAGARPAMGSLSQPSRRRILRIAHLTDLHIQPERAGGEGVAACLRHVQSLDSPPDLVLTGGDLIMDSFATDHARTRLQWDLFTGTLKRDCGIPVEHCLGNHDIWGWNKGKSRTTGQEPGWGKKWAVETLGLPERYRSFERAGWKFIVLDSTHTDPDNPDGYKARLDGAQFDWLKRELEAADKSQPVLVLSHIPILSASALVIGNETKSGHNVVSGSEMHLDCVELAGLFAAHGNVRLCLSGHMHKLDRLEYQGTTYICNGAVSGGWWKGPKDWCDEGYGIVDLFDDGTFENRYITFGWKAAAQ